jgi:hypothetical protein
LFLKRSKVPKVNEDRGKDRKTDRQPQSIVPKVN